ncbi:MAG: hypothetical protein K2K73_01040, partial [Ureaplasma sp.]|nr:hypothetical protein [Ureaplasma sp.]
MKNSLNKINNLISFHWVFIKNNPLLWILASIGCLTQTILFIFFEIFKLQLVDYALLLFLAPNIIYSIFIIVINYLLIQVNKDNSIDDRLLCSEFSKYQIKLARFFLVWIFLAGMIVISDFFLFYFVIRNQIMFGVATFISNTFITPFILLLISIIFTYLAIKLPKGGYVVLTILISFITFGLSLITRVFIPKPEIDTKNYYKLVQKDSQYLVEKTKTDINLNQSISTNTFVPSEWFYSFYSLVFGINNKTSNSDFSIRMNKLKLSNYDDVLNNDMPIMIREQDFNFLSLSTEEYVELICDNIEKIVHKYNLYQNTNLLKQVIENISTNFDWSYISNLKVINVLLDITGINTEYNQLFYLIKYNKV